MPSQLYDNSGISFVCARDFLYAGKEYEIGTDFPQEDLQDSPEVLVRSRYIIPVIEKWEDKPRHWYREVQLKENVLRKLGSDEYRLHPETKTQYDEETRRVGPEGEVTDVGDGREYVNNSNMAMSPRTDPSGDITRIQNERIQGEREQEENEMAHVPGKQEAVFVNGKEESEPLDMLNLENPEDAEVETKLVDEPENEYNEHQKELLSNSNPREHDDSTVGPDKVTDDDTKSENTEKGKRGKRQP